MTLRQGLARTAGAAVAVLQLLLASGVARVDAQQASGRIAGRILDAQTGRGLSDAGIQVVGTTTGTMSQIDGRYAIVNVASGTVTLHVRLIGYQPKTVTGILVQPGQAVEQNITLTPTATQLAAVEVTAESERGTVGAALDRQKKATGILNSVSAEQIAKSPDADAAQAVQRVSGVTMQEGRYVFVRGLGERYTTTSLNGARVPSPEPERKVVPLDLFPAGLLDNVTTSKTFTPDQPGDFSGAQVDIRTREFPAERQIAYSTSVGYNSRATARSMLGAPTEGWEWLGFGGGARSLPGIVAAAGNFQQAPSQSTVNQMVSAFRNSWTVRDRSGAPNSSFGASLGGSGRALGRDIGYVGALTYSYNQEIQADQVRANADATNGTREIDHFSGETGRASVLWGGLLNLSTLLGSRTRLGLNNTYNRTADNDARDERGLSENLATDLHIQRLRFVERSVRSNQLVLEHEINDRQRLDWSVTSSSVRRNEPDRSEIVYAIDPNGGAEYWFADPQAAVRTFGKLDENSIGTNGDYTILFGDPTRQHQLKFGGLFRYTSRNAENRAYSIQAPSLDRADRELPPEEIFDGRFAVDGSSVFLITPLSQGGSYDARDYLTAGYGMVEYALSDHVHVIGGARVEYSNVEVNAEPTIGQPVMSTPTYTDVLPALTVNVKLTEQQNLRFAASQTLSRPEYREISPVQYRDVLGGDIIQGNPDLKRALIQNADIRWEWYPNPGEVLSLGVFGKRFHDPIERVFLATSGTRIVTFQNAERGSDLGVEMEARKSLGFVGNALTPLSVFANATLMHSDINIGSGAASRINENRAMVGQAPYVINAGVTYTTSSARTSATLLYNRVGRRIVSAAESPLPDVYEEPRDVVDFSLRFPIARTFSAKFDAKNLTDQAFEQTQGTVTRERFRTGRVFSLGVNWQP